MRNVIPGFIVAATLIVTALLYPSLPEQLVTHWNLNGEPDGWSSRAFGAWLMPVIMFTIWVFMRFIPRIDPRAESYARFGSTYSTIITVVVGFMAVMHIAILGSAVGWNISVPRLVPFCTGVMLIVIGNLLPRARPNWFVGIRTPWTLSSDRVWERTHRLGGTLFVIAGFVLAATAFGPAFLLKPAILLAVMVGAVVPTIYSFVLWRREKKNAPSV